MDFADVRDLRSFARHILRTSTAWKAENLLRPRYVESNDILISNVTELLESLSTVSKHQQLQEIRRKYRSYLSRYEYVEMNLGCVDSEDEVSPSPEESDESDESYGRGRTPEGLMIRRPW